jgi:ABC-type multidrug transport system fused ATPase/permease subunit
MYPWGLPATILLGILSSVAEGIGISLFMPLLQSLDQKTYQFGAAGGLQTLLDAGLRWLPAGSNRLTSIVVLILAMTICKGLLMYSHSVVAAWTNSRVIHALRSRIFSRMIGISHRTLDKTEPGRLINLLATDTWHTSDALSLFVNLIINLCSILVFSTLLLALSWRLTLVVAIGVALISMILQAITFSARALGRQAVEANAVMSEQMLDGLEGVKVVQMFGLNGYLQHLFEAVSSKVGSVFLRLGLLHGAVHPLSEILYIGLLLGTLLIGVQAHTSLPTVVVFLVMLYRLQPQIRQLDSGRISLIALTSSVEDVMRLFDSREVKLLRAADRPFAGLRNEIRFEDVRFCYESDHQFALEGVSFTIPQGKTTAIIGPSGSGKTTIISLLCRFREPGAGQILVDDTPLAEIAMEDWRGQVAWAGQDAHLFSTTVRENILYGRLDASEDEISEAAIRADADGFIRNLPSGYQTKIGNGGISLSGGQAQRISLARAFLRNPDILILDEATSALDSVSEDSIQRALPCRSGRQTMIVISHRLSTVRYADHVIVLENGCVTGQGSSRELVRTRGFFSQLRELQHVD